MLSSVITTHSLLRIGHIFWTRDHNGGKKCLTLQVHKNNRVTKPRSGQDYIYTSTHLVLPLHHSQGDTSAR